jgi:hypothetical protein
MPIDPRIPLGVQPLQLPSPLDVVQTVAQIQGIREQTEARREQAELRRLAAEEARTKHLRQRQIDEAWEAAVSIDPASGRMKVDHAKLLGKLPGSLWPTVKKELDADEEHLLDLDTKRNAVTESQNKLLTSMADTIIAADYHPAVIAVQLKRAHERQVIDDATFAQLSQAPPEQLKALIQGSRTAPPAEKPQLVERMLSDGTIIKEWVVPKVGEGYRQAPKTTGLELKPVIDPKTGQAIYVRESEAIGQRVPPPMVAPSYQWATPPGATAPVLMTPQEIRGAGATSPTAGTAKPATGVERRTFGFFNRIRQADIDLESTEEEIANLGFLGQGRLAWAPNVAQSETGQLYTQAQRAFTEARLRKDSGAAIPPHEFESDAKTYFAQPGDGPAVIAQKRRARAALAASMARESGNALTEEYGEEAPNVIAAYKARAQGAPPPTTAPAQTHTVTAPNGKTYTFKSAAEAAAFKKRAGIP